MDHMPKLDKPGRLGKQSQRPSTRRGQEVTTARDGKAATEQHSGYKDRPWIPRFWDGMCVIGWFRLLSRNRFAVSPPRIAMAVLICGLSFINFCPLAHSDCPVRAEDRSHEDRGTIRFSSSAIGDRAPPCCTSCWCSTRGTRSPTPTPASRRTIFSSRAGGLKPCLKFLLPARRPMDNMAAGWDHPQEDEFALCNMGVPSPYLTIIFPNHPPQYQEYLDFRGVPPAAVDRWKRALLWFLKCITLAQSEADRAEVAGPHLPASARCWRCSPRRSSSTSSATRTPSSPRRSIFGSVSTATRACRCRSIEGLEEHVFQTFTRMYDAFERDRRLIRPGQFCEVRYEESGRRPGRADAAGLPATGAGRFRVGSPGDRSVFRRSEGLQDEPLSDHARNAGRDRPPLGQVSSSSTATRRSSAIRRSLPPGTCATIGSFVTRVALSTFACATRMRSNGSR